jgi:hypothetical protein
MKVLIERCKEFSNETEAVEFAASIGGSVSGTMAIWEDVFTATSQKELDRLIDFHGDNVVKVLD